MAGDQITITAKNIVRGEGNNAPNIQYLFRPAQAGNGIGGVALPAGAGPGWGAWATLTTVAIATEFWVCGMSVYTAGLAQVHHLQLQDSTVVRELANFLLDLTAATANVPPLLVPWPIYRPANRTIQGRTGGAGASAINAHLVYAVGL